MTVVLNILTIVLFVALLMTWEDEKKSMSLSIAYSVSLVVMVAYEIWSRTPR